MIKEQNLRAAMAVAGVVLSFVVALAAATHSNPEDICQAAANRVE